MRKIEKQMIEAIRAGREFKSGNTRVDVRTRGDGETVTSVYLHDNLIAQHSLTGWGFKLCGWDTPTTRSRINTIMREVFPNWHVGVHRVRKVLTFSHGAQSWAIDSCEWIRPEMTPPQLGAVRTK